MYSFNWFINKDWFDENKIWKEWWKYRHEWRIIYESFLFSSDFTGSVSLNSLWGSSDSSVGDWSDFYDSGVDGTTDTVLHFEVQLRNDVVFESSVFFEIFFGWLIDDVSDGESLDSFVFRAMSATVHTDDGSDVASVIFVSTVVSSLFWHLWSKVIY